jgi:hypothetical protein
MSSTDERVVKMQFDNAQFKKGAADTQKQLADLNKATDAAGKTKGLLDLNNQMGQVSVTASKMAIVTTTALATIANKVTNVAINMAKGLTLDPIRQGFTEYEELLTKQNTIMNATGKSAKEVKGYLTDLNTYSDQTIYSFGNMTASIVKFVNAGISLPQSVKSIKGIANAAAYAGASTEEANRAMYAFSQSMGTGFLMLNDWMQIENANMGTVQFKQGLIDAAVAAGTLTKRGKEYITTSGTAITATKGWRDGLQDQWATTEVMNAALAKYTDLSTKLGREATQSATEVRTFTAFMDTLKESLGSGWASIFTSLIGNLNQATKFWTGFSEGVGGAVDSVFSFLAATLKTWRQMGGFEKTLQGFKNILAPIGAILGTIGDAWRSAFPDSGRGAGKTLYGLSVAFEAVTRPLQWFADLIRMSTPVLTVFFQVLKIGGTVLTNIGGRIADFVKDLIGLAEVDPPSAGGFIGFIKDLGKAIANAVQEIDDLLQKGASLSRAFGSVDISLPSMPSMPSMPDLPSIGGIFGAGSDKAETGLSHLSSGVLDLKSNVVELNEESVATTEAGLFSGGDVMSVLSSIGDFIGRMKDAIANFFSGISMDDVVTSFNAAIFATMGFTIIRFVNTLRKTFESFMGFGEAFNQLIGDAGSALKAFQTQARAKLILNIALALLVLAGALFILSRIPMGRLAKALGALTATAFIMSMTMKSMGSTIEKLDGAKTGLKMVGLSIAVLALAGAMVLLATAFLIFNKVEWKSVVKGLTTMFVAMKLIESMGKLSAGAHKNLIGGAAAIMAVSLAMVVLAGALLLFKMVDWGSMGKAGAALAGITLAVGALALIPYAGIAKVGASLLMASVGMLAMANALVIFGLVKWESIGKAGVVLGILTAALAALMLVGNPVTITGMVSMAAAMVLLAGAMMILNNVEWSSIGKIAVIMGALILGFTLFLAVITAFAPALILLSAFAGSLALLALAITGLTLAFAAIFPLLAMGAGAFAAFATGAAIAFAVFMQTLAAEAPLMKKAFLDILEEMLDAMVKSVPMIIQAVKDMWEAVKKEFTGDDKKKSTKEAGTTWVSSAADGIKARMPEIVKKGAELLVTFLKSLRSKAGEIAEAGVDLVLSFLSGIGRKVGDIVGKAVELILKFAKGIKDGLVTIVNAGINLIGDFLHDLADAIRRSSGVIGSGLKDVIDAMKDVGMDIVNGMIDGIQAVAEDAINAIGDLGSRMIGKAKDILKIWSPSRVFKDIGKFLVQGLTVGIRKNAASAIVATASMITGQIAISESLINGMIQRLDQKALAARARAEGLARAAKKAQAAANKTKTKDDDKEANKLSRQARKADKAADKAAAEVRKQQKKEARRERWKNANELERAEIKAADAQRQIQAAKQAERDAAAARAEANALDKMSKAKGLTKKQREAMRKEADRLRKQAREDAKRANTLLEGARDSAASAMEWQSKAGKEAADNFQKQFEAEAKAAADAEAFEKLSAAEKAEQRRKEAQELQAEAEKNLAEAKKLAYSDIEAANAMAALALEQADRARALMDEVKDYEAQGGSGQVLNLEPTDAAALAFNQFADMYDSAFAAAAAAPTVEFTQINNSPESLSPSEIYRQTNNLLTYAADKVSPAA